MSTAKPHLSGLYARLEEVLGREHADALMTHLPHEPGPQLATKTDIAMLVTRFDRLETRMDARFEQVDQRFEQVDQRFEQVDQRFEHMERRFERVDQRLDHLERRFDQVDRHFNSIEQRFHLVRDDLRDQLKSYTLTTVGAKTALTAVFAALLTIMS